MFKSIKIQTTTTQVLGNRYFHVKPKIREKEIFELRNTHRFYPGNPNGKTNIP
jgi:hypothetical protein